MEALGSSCCCCSTVIQSVRMPTQPINAELWGTELLEGDLLVLVRLAEDSEQQESSAVAACLKD